MTRNDIIYDIFLQRAEGIITVNRIQYLLSFVHVIMALLFVFLSDYPMFRITTADILYVFHVLVMFCKNNFLYDLPLP